MDIETVLLNGKLDEEVFMKLPQGLEIDGKENWVCKPHKSLRKGELVVVAIYVDDLLLLSKTANVMKELKLSISARQLWISQQSNADTILKKFNMEHGAGVATPTAAGKKLTKQQAPTSEEATAKMLKKPFRQAIGSLMYQMIGSRPDMDFAIQDVSCYFANYGEVHGEAVKRCLCYLKATRDHGLEFSGETVVLRAFTDSGYASCEDDRRSVSSYVTRIGNCTVTWSSRKQRIVAQATAEAEYVALAHSTVVNEDNQACIVIAENPSHHTRVKHIDVRYHFIREHVQLEDVDLRYVVSKENEADIMTKGLLKEQFEYLRRGLNVKPMG
ncbi:Hypothetical protein PHPALM_8680 [Phytophthora palmivora]|uniref:Reverse transcriptase Ty1/copia-type domain-containing protein n=1 Tax=Phytophthora palmivora TaxID=4796 RepID=A0A2P4Y9P3_9STRA|nr:Hypothetical protein PHPALM_8680 [Phytophthora palmivora]